MSNSLSRLYRLAVLAAAALCTACTGERLTPPPAPPPAPTIQTAAKAPPTQSPGNATQELLAKLKPEGKTPPPPPPRSPSPPLESAPRVVALSAEEVAKLPSAEHFTGLLVAALGKGDAKAAEDLTLRGEALRKVVTPAYHDILVGSIEEQNRAVVAKLIQALQGKVIEHALTPGPITRAVAKGPLLEGTLVMSGAKLMVKSEGVAIEVGIDQLVLVGEEWMAFRLREP